MIFMTFKQHVTVPFNFEIPQETHHPCKQNELKSSRNILLQ